MTWICSIINGPSKKKKRKKKKGIEWPGSQYPLKRTGTLKASLGMNVQNC